MNTLVSDIVAIIIIFLYVVYILPLIPSPFGVLSLILIIVLGIGYVWWSGDFKF